MDNCAPLRWLGPDTAFVRYSAERSYSSLAQEIFLDQSCAANFIVSCTCTGCVAVQSYDDQIELRPQSLPLHG